MLQRDLGTIGRVVATCSWETDRMAAEWRIDLEVPPWRPTHDQRESLDALEMALSSRRVSAHDDSNGLVTVGPIVHALAESGMSMRQIADHSRIRPEGVERLLGSPDDR